jgi:hypothetical protein
MGICNDYLSDIRRSQDSTTLNKKIRHIPTRPEVKEKFEQFVARHKLDMNKIREEIPSVKVIRDGCLKEDEIRVIAYLHNAGWSISAIARELELGKGMINIAVNDLERAKRRKQQ